MTARVLSSVVGVGLAVSLVAPVHSELRDGTTDSRGLLPTRHHVASDATDAAFQTPGPLPAEGQAGTGAIQGTVTSASTGLPLRGAALILRGTTQVVSSSAASGLTGFPAATSGAPGAPTVAPGQILTRTTLSDAQGRFAFTGLPAGRYVVDVTREYFLPASHGQTRPGRAGARIDLADGAQRDLVIPMTRGSAISGLVTDEHGEPMVRARVRALRYIVNQNGIKRLRVVNQELTDDRGRYRFYQLAPGDYIVSASPLPMLGPDEVPSAETGQAELVTGDDDETIYAPTYHPGARLAAQALSIGLDGHAQREGVDIQVLPVLTANIEGTVAGLPESSSVVQVLLHNVDAAEEPTSLITQADPTGAFRLPHVAPGEYMVYAQTLPSGGGDPRTASFERLHGRTPLVVTGPDVGPLSIVLRPGRSISGRLVFALSSPPSPQARQNTVISITPSPQAAGWPTFNSSPQVKVDNDGRFTLPGIRPGRYFLRVTGPGMVASVMAGGVDTLDFPLEVSADQDVDGVVITLTDRPGELSGVVTDPSGDPGCDCTVLALSTDRRFWIPGSRRVAMARPGVAGRFGFLGLPAGTYGIIAVPEFDASSQFDPAFLQQVAGAAETVTITTGGSVTRNLRVDR